MNLNNKDSRTRAFGFINMLVTVAVIAIIGSIAYMAMTGVRDTAQEQLLRDQVATLNKSVKLYQNNGGTIDGLSTAQAVINKMKTMAANGEKMAGFRGNFIDPRLQAVEQTTEEAGVDGELRVIWDEVAQNFKIATGGARGIKEFKIDSTVTPDSIVTEERDTQFELAATSETGSWVWDFDTETHANVSAVQTTASHDPSLDINPDGGSSSRSQLATPSMSPSPNGTAIPLEEFGTMGKPITISDTNPEEHSQLYVSVNGSDWDPITNNGTVNVPPGGNLATFAKVKEASEHLYYSSYVRPGRYEASTVQLEAPSMNASPTEFHPFDAPEIVITAAPNAANDPAHSKVVYRVDSGEWTDYTGPVTLDIDSFSVAPLVQTKSVSSHADPSWSNYYLESSAVAVALPINKVDLVSPEFAVNPSELHPFTADTVTVAFSRAATDPDPEGAVSKIVYSTDSGDTWEDANDDVDLEIDDHFDGANLMAKTVPTARLTSLIESSPESDTVNAVTVTLTDPSIVLSSPNLDPLGNIEVTVSVGHSNPAEKTALEYSMDNGETWEPYSNEMVCHLDNHLEGFTVLARATGTAHPNNILPSAEVSDQVGVTDATLSTPEIVVAPSILNAVSATSTTISLNNPNSSDVSSMQIAFNGGDWQTYTDPIVVALADYAEGLVITAQAIATRYTPILYHSAVVSRDVTVKLSPPLFSIETSTCCENLYDKSLFLSDPNGIAGSTIYYSVNGGPETLYDPTDINLGAINIPGNTIVSAYCQAQSGTLLIDSESKSEEYISEPQLPLDRPTINPGGGTFTETVLVTIDPPVEDPDAVIIYTMDGSDPEVDENGNITNGQVYTTPFALDYFESGDRSLVLDWEDSLWNNGAGWLDYDGNQLLQNIGGLGIDVTVQQLDETALGAFLTDFDLGDDGLVLAGDGGENPDLGYSILFSQSVQLDTFTTGGLMIQDDVSMANRIDLYGDDGTQLLLGSVYVTSSQFANVVLSGGGIETVATSAENTSQTTYDFGGLSIQELQWLHYGYQASELTPPTPPTPNPDDECQYTQSFTLINTDTNEPIPGYDPIPDGIKINLAHLPSNISVRANINGTSCGDGNNGHGNNVDGFDSSNQGSSSGVAGVEDSDPTVDDEIKSHPAYGSNGVVGSAPKSVRLVINGASRVDNGVPFALKGDNNGSYNQWNPSAGTYTISATPYAKKNGNGNAGTPMTMSLEVIDDPSLPDPLADISMVGSQLTTFLSDINFHIAGDALLPANYTVKARAIPAPGVECRTYSQLAESNLIIQAQPYTPDTLPTPEITPVEGRFFAQVEVSIGIDAAAPENTRIYYSLDGSVPLGDESGNPITGLEYTGPFMVTHGGGPDSAEVTKYVRARAFAPEGQTTSYVPSNGTSSQLTFTPVERLNAPIISPSGNIFEGSVDVTIDLASNAPAGTRIYYNTNGMDPGSGANPTSGTLYSGPFTIYHDGSTVGSMDRIVTARAYAPAELADFYVTSYQAAELYTFNPNFVLTFDELFSAYDHGSRVRDEYASFGGGISISAGRSLWETFGIGEDAGRGITFDTSLTGTADSDLEALNLNTGNLANPAQDAFGNILIIGENMVDSDGDGLVDSPDDNAGGGWVHFDFASVDVSKVGFDLIDIDNGDSDQFWAWLYDDQGSYYQLSGSEMRNSYGSTEGTVVWGDYSANRIDPLSTSQLGLTNISGMLFHMPEAGGFDNIAFSLGGL